MTANPIGAGSVTDGHVPHCPRGGTVYTADLSPAVERHESSNLSEGTRRTQQPHGFPQGWQVAVVVTVIVTLWRHYHV